ncbi:MAG: hypothetical protein LC105_13415 [Chitinophagales bacterium]|nr:hypothetical protein [Chitinophagales bacterium]
MMKNIYLIGLNNRMPKASKVYRNSIGTISSTPPGSHHYLNDIFYKHQIPSGLKQNQKDSNGYQKMNQIILTLKGSHVYRKETDRNNTTLPGSHHYLNDIFYKHQIPSGLNTFGITIKIPKASNVYRKHGYVSHTTPMGSHNNMDYIFYKHQIPSGLKQHQKDSNGYQKMNQIILTLKGSHVYRKETDRNNTTSPGSHNLILKMSYKA